MPLPKKNGFALIPLVLGLVLIILVAVVGYFYWQSSQNVNVKGVANKKSTVSEIFKTAPTPTPSPWKTYENKDNNFQITYPRKGVTWNKQGYTEGECGLAIREEKGGVTLDNFYRVKVLPYQESLDEYLTSQRGKSAYEMEVIADSGADEATKLLRLKPDFEIAVGYPPLFYIKAVFKKGDRIYLLQEIVHNPTNEGGCVQPSVVDPTQYPDFAKQEWDLVKSIKFTP